MRLRLTSLIPVFGRITCTVQTQLQIRCASCLGDQWSNFRKWLLFSNEGHFACTMVIRIGAEFSSHQPYQFFTSKLHRATENATRCTLWLFVQATPRVSVSALSNAVEKEDPLPQLPTTPPIGWKHDKGRSGAVESQDGCRHFGSRQKP